MSNGFVFDVLQRKKRKTILVKEQCKKVCRRIVRFLQKRFSPLVIVYSMGKVGSSTVTKTLRQSFPRWDVCQVHFLSSCWIEEVLPQTNHLHNIDRGKRVLKLIEEAKKSGRPIKIVTLVRDPVSREISNFFENSFDYIDEDITALSKKEILHAFSSKADYDFSMNWFDREFKEYTGVDVYQHSFDPAKGYGLIRDGGWDILIMKLEKMNEIYFPAFKEFFGKRVSSLSVRNEGRNKRDVSFVVDYLKENYRIDDETINKLESSKFYPHFYSREEMGKSMSRRSS